MIWVQLRRPEVVGRARRWGANLQTRVTPMTTERALALIAREAVTVLASPGGRTATGVNIALGRCLWDVVELGAVVQRVRGAANQLDPPHRLASRLVVRPVPSTKLADVGVLVTTLRSGTDGTRLLGDSDVLPTAEGTLELVPLVEHVGRFVLPPNVTLHLGAQGDLVVPRPSADRYGVSRLHAALTNHDGELEVADLDSTNGVHVNGRVVTTTGMALPGDELACGNARWSIASRAPQSTG